MASTELLEILLDNMREAWDYFQRVQKDLAVQAAKPQPNSTDALLDHAPHMDFEYKINEMHRLEEAIIGDLRATAASPVWNTAHERCFRFLSRSMDSFYCLMCNYEEIVYRLQDAHPAGSPVDTVAEHCEGVHRMVDKLVRDRLPEAASKTWPCSLADQDCSDHHDHFHSIEELVWPSQDVEIERLLPLGSSPDVSWRHFAYEPKGKTVDRYGLGSVISALGAVEASIKLESGEEIALDEPLLFDETSEVGNLFEEKRFEEALATIGMALNKVLRMKASGYTLGIILPGGSHIFWPATDIGAFLDAIFIKMDENLFEERAPYSFQAVKSGKSNYGGRANAQTKEFLDLPPEIRNMIYERILHQEEDEQDNRRIPRRQPAISCTCRTVNKEVLSLVFHKYRWVLCR